MDRSITRISVVIPAYNESKRIEKTLDLISEYFSSQNFDYEIIVVDDGSSDNTAEICEEINNPRIKIFGYKTNRGKGFAVNHGVSKATKDYILFADADNSTPIEEFERLAKFAADYKVIIGSRYVKGSKVVVKQPLSRIIGGRLGNFLIQVLLLPGFNDTQCGFKLFEKNAARDIFSRQTVWRWGFDIEILYIAKKLRYKIKQVPVDWYNNIESKMVSSSTFFVTLVELMSIKWRALRGVYKH